MSAQERSPGYLIDNGLLERVKDFTLEQDVTIHGGQVVPKGTIIPASRLGWRINEKFAATYLGRMFNYPTELFTPDMLRPEEQGLANYVDGILNITEAQRKVAENYFKDGGVEKACPPLKALLHIMRDGHYEGKTIDSREVRELFALNKVLASDWYKARLEKKQAVEVARWTKNIANLEAFRSSASAPRMEERLRTSEQLAEAREMLARVSSPDFVQRLKGSIGRIKPLVPNCRETLFYPTLLITRPRPQPPENHIFDTREKSI